MESVVKPNNLIKCLKYTIIVRRLMPQRAMRDSGLIWILFQGLINGVRVFFTQKILHYFFLVILVILVQDKM